MVRSRAQRTSMAAQYVSRCILMTLAFAIFLVAADEPQLSAGRVWSGIAVSFAAMDTCLLAVAKARLRRFGARNKQARNPASTAPDAKQLSETGGAVVLRGREAAGFSFIEGFDVLGSNQPYSASFASEHALDYIRNKAGRLFDRLILVAFLENISRRAAVL